MLTVELVYYFATKLSSQKSRAKAHVLLLHQPRGLKSGVKCKEWETEWEWERMEKIKSDIFRSHSASHSRSVSISILAKKQG